MSAHAALAREIASHGRLAIAVSGGVDSMSLATFAHRLGPSQVEMVHAVSPAVPPRATARVRDLAAVEGWTLHTVGAGEFDDPRYRDNPADRCYFCKSNLYDRIRQVTDATVASGANLDDLGDYRPGLLAARERAVVHPFIDAAMDKAAVRELARHLGLPELAELPAQPCLSSRVETGIAIDPDDLAFIDRVEVAIAPLAIGKALRCRVTHRGVVLQSDAPEGEALVGLVEQMCVDAGRAFAGFEPYRRGSMFVRP